MGETADVAATVLCCAFLRHASAQGSAPWPMFRHDPEHTGRSPFAGPSKPHLAWSYRTASDAYSSPAPGSDGRLYVGSGADDCTP